MLKLWVSAVAILTRVSARKGQGGLLVGWDRDGRLCDDFCSMLVVNVLTRHTASLHANGVPFDLRKIYVSGCESLAFGW